MLAQALARLSGRVFNPFVIARRRATPDQGQMVSAEARRRNVEGAFAVPAASLAAVRGARILLVDDVFTTGATLNSCAAVLKRAGAARVDALTIARVVRPGS